MKVPIVSLALSTLLFTSCAPWNKVTREVPEKGKHLEPGKSCRFESLPQSGRKYAVSVVEFDGQGSFLKYGQMQDAIDSLRRESQQGKVLLVIYCHGWNNNSQSGNVVMFTQLLRRLASTEDIKGQGYTVHGVYLAWRGTPFFPAPTPEQNEIEKKVAADFGATRVTDPHWQVPGSFLRYTLGLARLFTYWNIKNRAENHVASVSLASSVYKLAQSVDNRAVGGTDRVFLVGHSFGCLVLDRSMNLASVGLIAADGAPSTGPKRWPFDLIVHLNSASPSLYAKQMADFLSDSSRTSAEPRFVSIVSETDAATRVAHVVGNSFTPLPFVAPDLQRVYEPEKGKKVKAWEYYAHTPANNPYLVNRQLVPAAVPSQFAGVSVAAPGTPDHDALAYRIFDYNVTRKSAKEPLVTLGNDQKLAAWTIQPKEGLGLAFRSNYWFMRVPDSVISGHTGVFSDASQQLIAGLFKNNRLLSKDKPLPPAEQHANQRDY